MSEAKVIKLREARLARATETITAIIKLMEDAKLDDGKPILIEMNGKDYLLLFGQLKPGQVCHGHGA